jgi:hypothetical protein
MTSHKKWNLSNSMGSECSVHMSLHKAGMNMQFKHTKRQMTHSNPKRMLNLNYLKGCGAVAAHHSCPDDKADEHAQALQPTLWRRYEIPPHANMLSGSCQACIQACTVEGTCQSCSGHFSRHMRYCHSFGDNSNLNLRSPTQTAFTT